MANPNDRYDFNRYKKVYPLIRTKPLYNKFAITEGLEAETAIVDFNNVSSRTYNFTKEYFQIPTVSATPEDENVNIFITDLSINSVVLQSSAPFVGKVHLQIFKVEN
jgi:hypothetical protein